SWNVNPRLMLLYGLRWELSPAPAARSGTVLAAWDNVETPSEISLAAAGAPLWSTTYSNFAPRIGLAYSLTGKNDLVLRAGWGIFYDLGLGTSGDILNSFPNSATGTVASVSLPVADLTPFLPSVVLQPPFPGVEAFSPHLKLPLSYQWNIALEKSFSNQQALSATYVGQVSRRLLRREDMLNPNPNFSSFFVLTNNDASSDYNALQIQYRRPVGARFQAMASYTWSHSIDNSSNDALDFIANAVIPNQHDRGSSDFHIRHSLSAALTYSFPAASRPKYLAWISNGWSVAPILVARSGFPFNASVLTFTVEGARTRPDLVPGAPIWISNPLAPAGKSLNPAAFFVPSTFRQGTEGRNDITGFGLA